MSHEITWVSQCCSGMDPEGFQGCATCIVNSQRSPACLYSSYWEVHMSWELTGQSAQNPCFPAASEPAAVCCPFSPPLFTEFITRRKEAMTSGSMPPCFHGAQVLHYCMPLCSLSHAAEWGRRRGEEKEREERIAAGYGAESRESTLFTAHVPHCWRE